MLLNHLSPLHTRHFKSIATKHFALSCESPRSLRPDPIFHPKFQGHTDFLFGAFAHYTPHLRGTLDFVILDPELVEGEESVENGV